MKFSDVGTFTVWTIQSVKEVKGMDRNECSEMLS